MVSFCLLLNAKVIASLLTLSHSDFIAMFELVSSPLLGTEDLNVGKVEHYSEAVSDHIKGILDLPQFDVEKVKLRKFKVCLDSINGVLAFLYIEFSCLISFIISLFFL
jgi:hypothetical protein